MIRLIYTLIIIFSPTTWGADDGALLFNGNCAMCHHLKKASSAPTIHEIRRRYLQAFPKKEDFVNYMSAFVLNPSEQKSLMHDKIEKYGLMPQLAFEEQSVRDIALYIYKGKIEITTH